MCIQSYYNDNQNREEEIELDLLKEIKSVGIDAWNEQVGEQSESKTQSENKTKEESEKEN